MSQITGNPFVPNYNTNMNGPPVTGTTTATDQTTVGQGAQTRSSDVPPPATQNPTNDALGFAPNGKTDELTADLEKLKNSFNELDTSSGEVPAFIGNIAELIGKLLIEHSFDQREQALKDRLAAREAAQAELMNQAGQMLEAAQKMMTGAITGMVLGIVAAGATVAGSLTSAIGGLKALKQMSADLKGLQSANKTAMDSANDASNLSKIAKGTQSGDGAFYTNAAETAKLKNTSSSLKTTELTNSFSAANQSGMNFSSIGQSVNAAGDMSKAVGSGVDGYMQGAAKAEEAEGQQAAASAQYQEQIADAKKEIVEQMKQMVDQIINFIKEMRDAEVDAMRAITRG